MKSLNIDWVGLVAAMETSLLELEEESYLDLQTGAMVRNNALEEESTRTGVRHALAANPGQYARIEPLDKGEILDIITRFSMTLGDKNMKELLWMALDSATPEESFRKALVDFPGLQEDWNYFLKKALADKALAWLASLGLEPRNKPPY